MSKLRLANEVGSNRCWNEGYSGVIMILKRTRRMGKWTCVDMMKAGGDGGGNGNGEGVFRLR